MRCGPYSPDMGRFLRGGFVSPPPIFSKHLSRVGVQAKSQRVHLLPEGGEGFRAVL